MSDEASPRPWSVHYGAEIWDANGNMVYNLNGFNRGRKDKKNAALIVEAVNERDLIATRLEAFDKRLEEAVAIHDELCAERDRLRDLIKRLITIREHLFWRKDERTGFMYYGTTIDEDEARRTIEEARAAIGEDKK